MRKYVMMGVQGSGKGTQSKLLAADLDSVDIGVGDIFRWNVQEHTKLGAQVRRILAEGGLVDDVLVESVVRDRLALHDWNYGFIIDGFPRNARQAEFFLESYDIDGVVVLELPDKEVHRRVLARRLCSRRGLDYNLIVSRPAEPETSDVWAASSSPVPTTRSRSWPPGWRTTTPRPGPSSSSSNARSSSPTSTPPRP